MNRLHSLVVAGFEPTNEEYSQAVTMEHLADLVAQRAAEPTPASQRLRQDRARLIPAVHVHAAALAEDPERSVRCVKRFPFAEWTSSCCPMHHGHTLSAAHGLRYA